MGVIKKILYRGNILGKPRHRNLFLDMEENIHIHYRDLRIELSRGEFEDIASAFQKQSQELLENDSDGLRKRRALAIADFVLSRSGAH